jgi:hypothetical protein
MVAAGRLFPRQATGIDPTPMASAWFSGDGVILRAV